MGTSFGAPWLNGQEDDLEDDWQGVLSDADGLKDKVGEVWVLASERVGCCEMHDPVMDRLEAKRARSKRDNKEKQDEGEEKAEESGRKGWIRKITVRTLSKDQGWSTSNSTSYGQLTCSRRRKKLISRHI